METRIFLDCVRKFRNVDHNDLTLKVIIDFYYSEKIIANMSQRVLIHENIR